MSGDRDPQERDPGLARERTSLSWTRTAIAFAALGGAELKVNILSGLIILAIAPLAWQLGRMSRSGPARTARFRLITISIVAASLLSLIIALLGKSAAGALR